MTKAPEWVRKLASDYHAGQWSGLYSLASSGTINRAAYNEVTRDLEDAKKNPGNWDHPVSARCQLGALRDYLIEQQAHLEDEDD